jgi:hypothetical protein
MQKGQKEEIEEEKEVNCHFGGFLSRLNSHNLRLVDRRTCEIAID